MELMFSIGNLTNSLPSVKGGVQSGVAAIKEMYKMKRKAHRKDVEKIEQEIEHRKLVVRKRSN